MLPSREEIKAHVVWMDGPTNSFGRRIRGWWYLCLTDDPEGGFPSKAFMNDSYLYSTVAYDPLQPEDLAAFATDPKAAIEAMKKQALDDLLDFAEHHIQKHPQLRYFMSGGANVGKKSKRTEA